MMMGVFHFSMLMSIIMILQSFTEVQVDGLVLEIAEPDDTYELLLDSSEEERPLTETRPIESVPVVDKRGKMWGVRTGVGIVPFYRYRGAVNYGANRHRHRFGSRVGWFRSQPYIKRLPPPVYDEIDFKDRNYE